MDLINLNVSSLIDAEERDDQQSYQDAHNQLILNFIPSNDTSLGLVKDFATQSLNAGTINQTCYDHVLGTLKNPGKIVVNRRKELDLSAVIKRMTWEEYSCYEDGEINDIDSKGQNGTLNIIHLGARAAIEIVTYYIKPPYLRPSKITIAGDLSSTIT